MARTRSAKRGGGQATVAGAAKATKTTKRRLGVRTHGGDGALHVAMPAMRGARAKAAAGSKHAGVQEAMQNLPSSAEHVRPSAPIRALLSDAREVLAIARRSGTKLIRAGLDRRFLEELPHRIELLDRAQKAWERQRSRTEPASLQRAREDAAQLKIDMLAAGRFLLRKEAKAQRQLDQFAAGEGLEDLIEDLRALAVFWAQHKAMLAKSDLGEDVVERAHAMAARLTLMNRGVKDREHDVAHARRNRALALLDEAVHEVRAAGRYVFRDAPERLALFRYEFRHIAR